MKNRMGSLALLAALVAAAPMSAQNVTVTSPTVKTVSGAEQNDAFAYDTWLRNNVRDGSSVGVNGTYAHDGNGSAFMQGLIANTSKADMEYYFGGGYIAPFTLGNLTSLTYDYYRDAVSTAPNWLAPSMRLYIDGDGDLSTTADRGYLVFEPVYNDGSAAIPTDSWQVGSITTATTLWFNRDGTTFRTLGQFDAGFTDAGIFISSKSVVLGLSSGIGSGWDGTFTGAIDDVDVAYTDASAGHHDVNFNFETASTTSTPEPASIVLLATGFAGIGGVAVKRRRKNPA
ncbi:MAG: PEP-CTERM sorting domain-containing protein [Gemmatimonadaceae bacterium]